MATPASYRSLLRKYRSSTNSIQAFFANFDDLVNKYEYEVVVAYCFLKLEQAYNRTLYGGVRKMRKVHSDIASRITDKQHLTRDGFLDLYENVFGQKLPSTVVTKIKDAEKTRDRIIHGKSVSEADSRKCLADILEFSHALETEVRSCSGFSPFGDMRGLTGQSRPLDKSTSRWVMKGLGFAVA